MGIRACLRMNDYVRVYLPYASVCVHVDVCGAVLLGGSSINILVENGAISWYTQLDKTLDKLRHSKRARERRRIKGNVFLLLLLNALQEMVEVL